MCFGAQHVRDKIKDNMMAIQDNSTAIGRNSDRIDENSEGVALAMAMSGIVFKPDAGDTFTVSGNWGNYDGENALAFGATGRVGDGWYVSGGVGVGLDEGKAGGRAGVHA